MKLWDNVGDPRYFLMPLSLEVVKKLNKFKSFMAPNFFRRDDPDFSTTDS